MTVPSTGRLTYLDQFRGYTVFGMIVVNYLGGYHQQIHPIFHHHNTYCSYADTIMPQFFFAVGFALRYTMVKRLQSEGAVAAHWRIVKRVFALLLIGALVHGFNSVGANWKILTTEKDFIFWLKQTCSREFFQTLTHIAVTTLWVLPVIGRSWSIRLLWLLGSAALHLYLSNDYYLKFAVDRPVIDGGPLGFLTWTIPVLAGSFVSDVVTRPGVTHLFAKLLAAAIVVMALGYGLSCLNYPPQPGGDASSHWVMAAPPFMPPYDPADPNASYEKRHRLEKKSIINLWTMSQQTGATSYLVFGTGFSLLVLALCWLIFGNDYQIGIFRSLGSNALIAYIVHGMAIDAVVKLYPRDSPLWLVLVGLAVVLGITWLICTWLEKRGWYVRV